MKKIYNSRGIELAAFLGGPLAAGYLFAANYKSFSKNSEARRSLWTSVILTIVVIASTFVIPDAIEEKIPNMVLPLIFFWVAKLLVGKYQKSFIENHISEGGEVYSNWRATGISVIFVLLTVIIAIVIFVLADLLAV